MMMSYVLTSDFNSFMVLSISGCLWVGACIPYQCYQRDLHSKNTKMLIFSPGIERKRRPERDWLEIISTTIIGKEQS